MDQWQVYLLLGLLAIVGVKLLQYRRPDRDFQIKKILIMFLAGMGFWAAWERMQDLSQTFGYGWIFAFVLIAIGIYAATGLLGWKRPTEVE